MKYQLSHHLQVSPDDRDRDKVLLHNLYYGTRMLAGEDAWPVMDHYRDPQDLGDSAMDQRLLQARMIAPVEQPSEVSELVPRFDEVSRKVLKYRRVEPAEDMIERLEQLGETCRPMSMAKPKDYFVWHDPTRVFHILLDHFRVFLEKEVEAPQTGRLGSALLRMAANRPPRQESLEQQVCSLGTSWARAEKACEGLTPEGRILVLGDDDLVSLALTQFPQAQSIEVLEFDSKLVRLLKSQGGDRLKVTRRDLSSGLPERYHQGYDVVLSDPMYAEDGMEFFLFCAAQALKDDGCFLLSTYPPLLENPKYFMTQLAHNGLGVRATTENYNRYPFPEDMRSGAYDGLVRQGYHPKLARVLVDIPYLYAHLYECERIDS